MIYRPDRTGLERFLGPTEAYYMAYLWSCRGGRTLRQIMECRSDGRAKTSVQTTLNRLARKGLLRRTETPRDYRYTPTEPREAWEARMVEIVRGSL